MKPKLKPGLDLESIQADLIETVCCNYQNGVSVRSLARQFELSPMKTRKILITGGVYSTDLSTEIEELYKDGRTIGEIAEMLSMTKANVNSYLPYESVIYNMEERSVEADRQARYRERLRNGTVDQGTADQKDTIKHERIRNKTMVVIVGKKLRKVLPAAVFDAASDPLSREKSTSWRVNGLVEDPPDPDKSIWCAELTENGRGKDKKSGIVLESANSGFAVICALPSISFADPQEPTDEEIKKYRAELGQNLLHAIRQGMKDFALPEERVLDYTDTVARIEIIKGKPSIPLVRVEELIGQELKWEKGWDPMEHFKIRGNFTSRKFGNSAFYRRVDEAVCNMLGLSDEEKKVWLDDFMRPLQVSMADRCTANAYEKGGSPG